MKKVNLRKIINKFYERQAANLVGSGTESSFWEPTGIPRDFVKQVERLATENYRSSPPPSKKE